MTRPTWSARVCSTRYAQEHPEVAALAKQENQQDWQWVQKSFEKLQLHRKQPRTEHLDL